MAADLNEISRKIVDAAVQVHKVLGPGLLESVYRECLVVHELRKRGLSVRLEVDVPIVYDGIKLASTLRLDLLVNEEVIVELKSIEDILAVHRGQLLSYLRLSNKRIGLLINQCRTAEERPRATRKQSLSPLRSLRLCPGFSLFHVTPR